MQTRLLSLATTTLTLILLTGCSDKTAKRSTARAVELRYIRREEHSKYVNFYPAGLGKSEDFPNNEKPENGGQIHFEYQ